MTLHKEGTPSIILVFAFALVLNGLGYLFWWDVAWAMFLCYAVSAFLIITILQFFRKPNRAINALPNAIISPADGKVVVIEETEETEYLKEKRIQVSIFMSPINVHINWLPVAGDIVYDKYHPGKFLVAWHPKSSTENERTTIVVKPENKPAILLRQIAGALARRIVYYVKEGQKLEQGHEMGFIKFGSRVDLFLPLDADIKVEIGQKVQGRQTVIAEYKS